MTTSHPVRDAIAAAANRKPGDWRESSTCGCVMWLEEEEEEEEQPEVAVNW